MTELRFNENFARLANFIFFAVIVDFCLSGVRLPLINVIDRITRRLYCAENFSIVRYPITERYSYRSRFANRSTQQVDHQRRLYAQLGPNRRKFCNTRAAPRNRISLTLTTISKLTIELNLIAINPRFLINMLRKTAKNIQLTKGHKTRFFTEDMKFYKSRSENRTRTDELHFLHFHLDETNILPMTQSTGVIRCQLKI